MAHVLLGWELGGNRGHATTLLAIARALRARGHRLSFALQRLDCLGPEDVEGAELWQAPITPRLLLNSAKLRSAPPATMGDILVRLGFDDPWLIESLIRGWDRLFAVSRPDLVVADYGPFLLAAARGRVPTVSVGTPFGVPPSTMPRFPSLNGAAPAVDEEQSLAVLNGALARCGRAALGSLPEVFASDRALAGGFSELDPYREWRTEPLVRPATGGPVGIAPAEGEEIFVYAPEQVQLESPLWQGLAETGLPVRVYVSSVAASYRERLRGLGLRVEDRPLPFDEIGRRSRLLLSHGGHGFVCAGLLAGLPQVICHYDLEKYGIARAVTDLGAGGMVPLGEIEPKVFAGSLAEVYGNQALGERARTLAPDFQGRHDRPMEEAVADAVDRLLGTGGSG